MSSTDAPHPKRAKSRDALVQYIIPIKTFPQIPFDVVTCAILPYYMMDIGAIVGVYEEMYTKRTREYRQKLMKAIRRGGGVPTYSTREFYKSNKCPEKETLYPCFLFGHREEVDGFREIRPLYRSVRLSEYYPGGLVIPRSIIFLGLSGMDELSRFSLPSQSLNSVSLDDVNCIRRRGPSFPHVSRLAVSHFEYSQLAAGKMFRSFPALTHLRLGTSSKLSHRGLTDFWKLFHRRVPSSLEELVLLVDRQNTFPCIAALGKLPHLRSLSIYAQLHINGHGIQGYFLAVSEMFGSSFVTDTQKSLHINVDYHTGNKALAVDIAGGGQIHIKVRRLSIVESLLALPAARELSTTHLPYPIRVEYPHVGSSSVNWSMFDEDGWCFKTMLVNATKPRGHRYTFFCRR